MIIVLNYGKVGSSAVAAAAREAFGADVFHSHGLRPPVTTILEELAKTAGTEMADVLAATSENAALEARLAQASRDGETVTLITGVRDPVSRSVSACLQTRDTLFKDCNAGDPETTADRLSARLVKLWLSDEPPRDPVERTAWFSIHAPLRWLGDEIEQPFGFDLREAVIDPLVGYRVLRRGPVRLLIYRLENAPRAIEAGSAELFPETPLRLVRRNTSEQRGDAALDASIRARLRLPRDVLTRIYAIPWVAAHYSSEERAASIDRWSAAAPARRPARDMSAPTATALVTVRDRERWVGEQIDSLGAQWREDMDMLVVDDGSTDGSYEAAKAALGRAPRVRATLVRNERSLGMAVLPQLLSLTDRPILIQADSDDVSLPGRLDAVMGRFDADPDCRLVTSNAILTSAAGAAIGLLDTESEDVRLTDAAEAYGKVGDGKWIGATAAFSRSLLADFPFDAEQCPYGLDNVLAPRALLKGTHHYLSEPLVAWRQHVGNSHRSVGFGSSDPERREDYAALELMGLTQRMRDLEHARADHPDGKAWTRAEEAAGRLLLQRLDVWGRLRAGLRAGRPQPTGDRTPVAAAPPILTAPVGERIMFGASRFGSLVHGWSGVHGAEAEWNWTSRRALVTIRAPTATRIRIGVAGLPFAMEQHFAIHTGDGAWSRIRLSADSQDRSDVVSSRIVPNAEGIVSLHLHAPQAIRPCDVKADHLDGRLLGARLLWLETTDGD